MHHAYFAEKLNKLIDCGHKQLVEKIMCWLLKQDPVIFNNVRMKLDPRAMMDGRKVYCNGTQKEANEALTQAMVEFSEIDGYIACLFLHQLKELIPYDDTAEFLENLIDEIYNQKMLSISTS